MKRAYVRALMRMAGMTPHEIAEELNWWRRIGLTYAQISDMLFDVVWAKACHRASQRLCEEGSEILTVDEVNRVFAQEIGKEHKESRRR